MSVTLVACGGGVSETPATNSESADVSLEVHATDLETVDTKESELVSNSYLPQIGAALVVSELDGNETAEELEPDVQSEQESSVTEVSETVASTELEITTSNEAVDESSSAVSNTANSTEEGAEEKPEESIVILGLVSQTAQSTGSGSNVNFNYPAAVSQVDSVDPNPNQDAPGYLSERDNSNGTRLKRISQNAAFGTADGKARHQYSKRQVWNADQTLMDVGNKLLDADSHSIVLDFIPLSSARVWSTVNPNEIIGIHYGPEPNRLSVYNVQTGQLELIRHFPEYEKCFIGHGEGTQSQDDRYFMLSCISGDTTTLVSYDMLNDAVLGTMTADSDFNWGSYTQSGDHILVENARWPNPPYYLYRYNRDFSGEFLLDINPNHGDLGIDASGNDVYVQISWDWLYYIRVSDGERVNLSITDPDNGVNIGFGHVSCRATNRPGWCYFSGDNNQRLGAAKIDLATNSATYVDNAGRTVWRGAGEVEQWGHHRSSNADYDAQAKASVNQDGTKIVFTSDWYGRDETVGYLLEYPQ